MNMKPSTELRLSVYLVFLCVSTSLASFNVGFNTGVVNLVQRYIQCNQQGQNCIPMSDLLWGLIVGMFALGGGIGALITFNIYKRLSRLQTLLAIDATFIIGGILLSTSSTVIQLCFGRLVVGISSGASGVLVSNYISEISTIKASGFLGAMLQITLALGILTSQILGLFVSSKTFTWKILFSFTCIPAFLQLVALWFMVETPNYLIYKKEYGKAKESLQLIRKGCDTETEYDLISQKSQENVQSEDNMGIKKMLKMQECRKYVIVAIVLHASQQLCAINGFLYYSSSTLKSVFNQKSADSISIGISTILLLSSILCSLLLDKVGRRSLLLAGTVLQTTMALMVFIGSRYSITYLVGICVMGFVFAFAIGLGTIPWVIIGELFPNNLKTPVSSLSIATNWMCNFLVAFFFPYYFSKLESYAYLPITVLNLAMFIFVYVFVPETKGRVD